MPEVGPSHGRLTIHTGRAGMAARVGHDLVIEAERWNASVAFDESDPQRSEVRAAIDATSLRVREGNGGVKPLSDSDREEIRRNLEQKVLASDRHPQISFVSTAVEALDGGRWQVLGDLTIAGTTSTVRIPVEVDRDPGGTRMRAAVTIAQTSFGIKPYSAMMGALKVADQVEIRVDVLLPASAATQA